MLSKGETATFLASIRMDADFLARSEKSSRSICWIFSFSFLKRVEEQEPSPFNARRRIVNALSLRIVLLKLHRIWLTNCAIFFLARKSSGRWLGCKRFGGKNRLFVFRLGIST